MQLWIQDVSLGGGTDRQCGHFSVEMCAKIKELGPIGGGHMPAAPLGSATATVNIRIGKNANEFEKVGDSFVQNTK